MTDDRSDAVVVTHNPTRDSAPIRRVIYEPRASGNYNLIEQTKRRDGWHTTGQKLVASVSVETPD